MSERLLLTRRARLLLVLSVCVAVGLWAWRGVLADVIFPPAPLTGFSGPRGVASGDFNHDFKPDLAVANSSNNTVGIALGNGDGTFAAPSNIAVGTAPYDVVTGHFNGDNALDLAVANQSSNTVTILLGTANGQGNGTGAFNAPGSTVAVGAGPRALALTDVNGDEILEIVVANTGANTLNILTNNGFGVFTNTSTITVGTGPQYVASADLDNDNDLDLVVANFTSNNISILINNGSGSFTVTTSASISQPSAVAVGRYNNDTAPDLAVTAYGNNNTNSVVIMLGNTSGGNPTGTFASPVASGAGAINQPNHLVTGDFDADGKADLAVASLAGGNSTGPLVILKGNGDGAFTLHSTANGAGPYILAPNDFNLDGHLDLAATSPSNNHLRMLLGLGDGTFSQRADFAAGPAPYGIAATDFNDDGKQDVVVTNNNGGNTISVLRGNGDNTLQTAVNYTVGTTPQGVAVGDFNQDAKPDVAVANSSAGTGANGLSVLLNTSISGGALSLGAATSFTTGNNPRSVAVGNFNAGSNLDIVIANGSSNSVSFLAGDGTGGFAAAVNTSVGTAPQSIAAADLDNDGDTDAVTANNGTVTVLLNNGSASFTATSYSATLGGQSVTVGDFDGDTRPDLAVVGSSNNELKVLLQVHSPGTAGTFQTAVTYTPGLFSPASVVARDFDSDNDLDLAISNNGISGVNYIVTVLRNNGSGAFSGAQNHIANTAPRGLAAAQFNGDARPELVAAYQSGVSIFPNVFSPDCVPPTIDTQPVAVTSCLGGPATFSVTATGTNLTYQWHKDGQLIDGATSDTYTIASTIANDASIYNVKVKGACNTDGIDSNLVALTLESLTVAPTSQNFPAAGGNNSIALTDSTVCGWTAISNNSFIHITSAASGTGAATVTYSVDANTGAARAGTLTVAGQTVNITQDAGLPAIVLVVDTTGDFGGSVTIPITLTARGGENGVAFTLNYDQTALGNPVATLGSGATSATLLTNDTQAANGRFGVALALPAGTSFTAGLKQIVNIQFNATKVGAFPVTFGDVPVVREVTNANANPVNATFTGGTATLRSPYEADTAPVHDGDGAVNAADVTQAVQFALGSATPDTGREFQRADSAPRNSLGDGRLTVSDVAQTARYAATLDALTNIGGPSDGTSPTSPAAGAATLRAANSEGDINSTVVVPVELIADGTENAASFTLNFNQALLSYQSATLGSDATGATLALNTAQTATGRLGVLLYKSAGTSFAAGTRQILNVTFNILATSVTTTPVTLDGLQLPAEIASVAATPTTPTLTAGTVSIRSPYEADTAPVHDGDGTVNAADVTQAARFAAALDAANTGREFQRADSAPRNTLGDGRLTVSDLTQTARYAATDDALTNIGGPSNGTTPTTPPNGAATIRAVDSAGDLNSTVVVPVELIATGTENGVSFTLNYDTARLGSPSAALGSDATGATLVSNTSQTGSGRLGVVIYLPAGQSFAAGTKQILNVTFNILGSSVTTTQVTFSNTPVTGEVASIAATPSVPTFTAGTVTLRSPYEADTAPVHDGDGAVDAADVTQSVQLALGFAAADAGREFQRADSAPRNSLGDGRLTVSDVAQTARYAATLDALTNIGGPSDGTSPTAPPNGTATVRAVSGEGDFGSTITVPVELIATGTENAVGFTLNFDATSLSYQSAALGNDATGATLALNTAQTATGRLGVLIYLPAGQSFTAGTKQILNVAFSGVSVATTNITFNSAITAGEVASITATPSVPTFTAGSVTVNAPYEGDTAPRPTGNGTLSVTDFTQAGRFVVALDTANAGREFQRADTAPRSSLGDGRFTVSDFTQAGRYVAGLDPLTNLGGPANPLAPQLEQAAQAATLANPSSARILSLTNQLAAPGSVVRVPVQVEAQGDENAFGFSLQFDPALLGNPNITLGPGLNGATLIVNANQAANGRLGVVVALAPGQSLNAGTRRLVNVDFTAANTVSATAPVRFTDTPIAREVSNPVAQAIPAGYSDGAVTIGATLALNDVRIVEGDNGQRVVNFTVTLNGAAAQPVSVNYATSDSTATAGVDYMATSGAVSFNGGQTRRNVSVLINGDTQIEPDETFTLTLAGPANAVIARNMARVTIVNDDAGGPVGFNGATISVNENAGLATVTLTRSGNLTGSASIGYGTSEDTEFRPCDQTTGQASSRCDYTAAHGRAEFAPGATTTTFDIILTDDAYVEGNETLNLSLNNPLGVTLGAQTTATLTIADNDTTPPNANPIDGNTFFVRQHYADFLSRQPDADGLAYWVNELNQCGTDAACLRARRIGVSAAFFVELEFQETGAFVYRAYKAAFGARPGYEQFVPARAQVVGGVDLETGKWAFAEDFTASAAFVARYPLSMSGEQFVDALLATVQAGSGVNLASARASLLEDYDIGGRALVLRNLADNPALAQAEYNKAFVLMQYYGYLRRAIDPAGYDFWLDVITNREPGNYRGMGCAFITAYEYQDRYSSIRSTDNGACQ